MDKQIREIAYFISFSIEQYMNEKGIDENQVISIFSEHNILDYLNEHYEVLHTQSRQWLATLGIYLDKLSPNNISLRCGSLQAIV